MNLSSGGDGVRPRYIIFDPGYVRAEHGLSAIGRMWCFVELDRIPVGIVDLDLLASRPRLDLVSEARSCRLE
jgi:hypothetical protein